MIFDTVEAFQPVLTPSSPLLGLDLGTQTIGLALSDVLWTTATPLSTQRRKKFTLDADALLATASFHAVGGLVIGLPLNMDGSQGPRAQSTRAFAQNLLRVRELPILLWDERLSTLAANRALLEADLSRKRRAQVIDSVAASYILQGALDRIAYLRHAAT